MALIKSVFIGLVLVVLFSSQVEGNNNNFNSNLAMASKTLSDKGFHVMSMIFNVFFKTLNSSNGNLTIFCPPDTAFFSSKYPQPPLTLLQYHAVPLRLNIEDIGFIHHGSKIDTLLLGHPLVVTTLPSNRYMSLNEVRVAEWNLYNDGGLIVHGVDNFFDPAFQTLIYPWLDHDVKKQVLSIEGSSRFYKVKELTVDRWFGVLAFVVIGFGVLVLSFYRCYHYSHDHDYVPIHVHDIAC